MAVTRIFEHIPATSCDPAEHERMYWGRDGTELEDHGDFIDFPHPSASFRSFQHSKHSIFAACRALKYLSSDDVEWIRKQSGLDRRAA